MFQVQSSWHASACGVSKLCRSRRGECMPISQEGKRVQRSQAFWSWGCGCLPLPLGYGWLPKQPGW